MQIFSKAYENHAKYQKLEGEFSCGTAGFRLKASMMPFIAFRMGLVASLKSMKDDGRIVGVMITASHNPEEDNGIKMCDFNGDMVNEKWEKIATEVVNLEDEKLWSYLACFMMDHRLSYSIKPKIVLGYDTRSSSIPLSEAFLEGLHEEAAVLNLGLVTTPQLHYLVVASDAGRATSTDSYIEALQTSFKQASFYFLRRHSLVVDCANGVGAVPMKILQQTLSDCIEIKTVHAGEGKLNSQCGADYVKMTQSAPYGLDSSNFYASLDGDADRVLFFYFKNGNFMLLDGDKISALFAYFWRHFSRQSGVDLEIGVVQTAYSNGNFTFFIRNTLGLPLKATSTGVKHLHHAAKEFQVGIYFEANGHGTVLLQPSAIQKLKEAKESGNTEQQKASSILLAFISLINPTVGDGIADLLCVVSCLSILDWSFDDWSKLYQDLPNKQIKVKVNQKDAFKVTNADTVLIEPPGLQKKINDIVQTVSNGRCFVRPSGTEDCVRIYAEASSSEEVQSLINQVAALIK